MNDEEVLASVRSVFGACPEVFARMYEAGEIATHWPEIQAIELEPGPIPGAVVQAVLAVLSLRCRSNYCFTMHGLTLAGLGASIVDLAELARAYEMPPIVEDHERWSRIIKLTCLSSAEGPQREAADFLLAKTCSELEYAFIQRILAVDRTLTGFTVDPPLDPAADPVVRAMPEQLQALVPKFVHFHVAMTGEGGPERPVSAICSVCRALRSTEGQWFPYAAAQELLADDVLFSHGLCPSCLEECGVPAELR